MVETRTDTSRRARIAPIPEPAAQSARHSAGAALLAAALGAAALGALAIGALAIGRLAVRSARIRRLQIDELVVGKTTTVERPEDKR